MTACVNNEKEIKGGVSGKVLRTVAAGVLAMSMMPAAALATTGDKTGSSAELQAAITDPFEGGTFTWSVDADENDNYYVPAGDSFYLVSAADAFGTPISMSDVKVVYFAVDGNGDPAGNAIMTAPEFNKQASANNSYVAVVVEGASHDIDGGDTYDGLFGTNGTLKDVSKVEQPFKMVAKSLKNAFAYEGSDTADTSFKYGTFVEADINFADAEGNKLVEGEDYAAVTCNVNAGTHTVVLTGMGEYTGSTEMVTYTVSAIDLAKDEITVLPILAKKDIFGANGVLMQSNVAETVYLVNGEPIGKNIIKATLTAAVDIDGEDLTASYDGEDPANIVVDLAAGNKVNETAKNVLNSKAGVRASVVAELADFYYGDEPIEADGKSTFEFVTAKGEAYDESQLTAWLADNTKVAVTSVEVTKDGAEATDLTEPGEYQVTAYVAASSDLSYAGAATFTFTVTANSFSSDPKVFMSVDGKDIASLGGVEYDGKAVVPTVVAKDGTKTLTEGTDYVVTYEDEDGAEVESMVEPGDYTIVVDFLGATWKQPGPAGTKGEVENVEQPFTIDKATIESAEADQDLYAYTGEPVAPTFTAYTNLDGKGLSVAVDPAETAVDYYKAVVDPATGEPYTAGYNKAGVDIASGATGGDNTVAFTGWKYDPDAKLSASDIVEPGFYVAIVTAPAGNAHFKGTAVQAAQFEVSEYAKYEDVDADAWYANSVYAARDLDYMSGVSGTKLFMPNAPIVREQVANVLFRMAGADDSYGKDIVFFPTKFSDVESLAWYAKPISWAYEAGVMGGYGNSDVFGVGDETTREQVAVIFYNYAKSQGKDVTVADEAAALAKVNDADTISDWAKPAVAWAVENGIMGNGGSVMAQNTITRAEMAAMAVNFQPEALK